MPKKQKESGVAFLKALAEEYGHLVVQIDALVKSQDLVKEKMKEEMKKAKVDRLETNPGTFSFYKRASWLYSADIKSGYELLKKEELAEQESGVAKKTESEVFKFTPVKVNVKT